MVVSFSGVVACSGAPESSSIAHPPAEGTILSRTVVRLQKDAKPIITRLPITQGTGGGLKELGCPPGACGEVVDSGCAQADLWLFDQPNFTGNELCVISAYAPTDTGFLDLADVSVSQACFKNCVPRLGCEVEVCPTWSGRIRSWSAGPGVPTADGVAGIFYQVPFWVTPPGIEQYFGPWAFESNASPIVKAAVTLQY
jgi:hypothetical protein